MSEGRRPYAGAVENRATVAHQVVTVVALGGFDDTERFTRRQHRPAAHAQAMGPFLRQISRSESNHVSELRTEDRRLSPVPRSVATLGEIEVASGLSALGLYLHVRSIWQLICTVSSGSSVDFYGFNWSIEEIRYVTRMTILFFSLA